MTPILRRLLIAAWLLGLPLAASADSASLAKAEALMRDGKATEAYALLEPLEATLAGDLAYDYLLATASLATGRPSKATFIYERILAIQPDYVGVRADMGRAFYMMGDLAKAKIEFESVLAFANLPPDLRSAVEQYMAAIEQRARREKTVVTGYFEAGAGADSNVLAATSLSQLDYANGTQVNLGPESMKRGNRYTAYAAGAELNHAFDDRLSGYVGGDYRGRSHASVDAADNYTLDGRAGLQYAGGRYLLRGGMSKGRYWLDNAATRDSTGINLDWRYVHDEKNQLTANGTALRFQYIPFAQRSNDFDLFAVALGWVRALAASTSAGLTLSFGEEDATGGRLDGDKSHWALRGIVQHSFSPNLGSFITAGYQPARYKMVNTDFDRLRRDHFKDLTAGLVWSLQDRWSVRTTLTLTKNSSNIPINAYDRSDASVMLRKDF
ncbi:hypothetical protein RHDC4_00469 [Rhodocyclaceae bacterium]|nr:hypothetical protein RHDC4_00469 [Rhodocyclaceae bacterium]